MTLMILGLLILIAGIVLLVVKKKKKLGTVLLVLGLLAAVIGFLWVGTGMGDDETDSDTDKMIEADSFIEVPSMDGIKADEDKITFDASYASISIEPDDAGEDLAPGESPSALHPEDKIEGVTGDGIAWSTDKRDGTGTIHLNVNGKPVSATVKPKADEKSGSKDMLDAGQAAAAVAALVNTGYKKGSDNYDHNYAIWYSEPAQCLVYYPAQLRLSATYEDGSVVFADSRSKAKFKITLEDNDFACMDDVESFIANTDYNKVLATGTDWYSCETVGKTMTEYSVTGLGQKHSVNATLTYENQYDFVFRELRTLIKCKFVEGGKWVSNETRESAKASVGKVSPVFKQPYADGMNWKLTSWFFSDWTCYLIYPDVFTKAYRGEDNEEYFTDPKTGAYIHVYRRSFSGSLQDVIDYYDLTNYDISGENSVRGYYQITGYMVNHFIVLRDGYEYHASMYAPDAYAHLYEQGASAMQLTLPGEKISNNEMQDFYFPQYRCYATFPLQFTLIGQTGTEYNFRDNFNGLDMKITFTDVTADTDTGNIFDMFNVVADDQNLSIGNNVVKWHSQDGLYIAALGDHHAGMLQMDYPNAQTAYEKSWTRFNMRFDDSAKAETIADRIVQDIKVAKIEAEAEKAKQDAAAVSGKAEDKDGTPTAGPEGSGTDSGQKPDDMTAITAVTAATPAIIAQPVNNELPENSDWMYDEKQNVVLWYKDYEDYRNVSLTADTWFKSEELGFSNSHFFKWGTLAVINSVLGYNEYDINVTKDWIQYDAVAKVNIILEDWYDDPQAGSQLGDGIVSVFEAYCEVLGIEVPDYVSNAKEPEIEPAEPTAAPRPTQATVPTAAPDDPSQGGNSQIIPDTELSDDDEALMQKLEGYWKYADTEIPVIYCLTEDGNWIRWFDDHGEEIETSGRMLIADDGSVLLCDWDMKEILYTLKYEDDTDRLYDRAYEEFILRDLGGEPEDDPEEYPEDDPTLAPIGDDYTMLHPEYRDAFMAITKRVGRETIFEELAAAMGIADFGTPACEVYGSINYVDIGFADTSAFQSRLKKMGLSLSGEDNSEGHAVGYYGNLSGYEYLNAIHVTIWELSDHTEITWILTDNFVEHDMLHGGLSSKLPFSVSDFGYGNVYTDVHGTSRFGHIVREMYDGAKKLVASSNGFGTGKGTRDFSYVCEFGTSLDDYETWFHSFSIRNVAEVVEKYNIPGYYNASIDESAMPFYNANIHAMCITPDTNTPFNQYGIIWYIPEAGVCTVQDHELIIIK